MAEKNVPSLEDLLSRWIRLFESLSDDSEYVRAIVATSYVEHCLGTLLDKFMIEGRTANLGNLDGRAHLAYSLGLISEGCKDSIKRLANIRNRFAHDIDMSFDDPSVAPFCRDLYMLEGLAVEIPSVELVSLVAKKNNLLTNSGKFTYAVISACAYLTEKARGIEHLPKLVDDWDKQSGKGVP